MKIPTTASWIWTPSPQGSKEQYVRFRNCFQLDRKPASAKILISADSRYRLYINETYIAFGPSRSYPHQQCIDVFDVADFLQSGDNLIAVLVYQPGYPHYSYIHQGQSGLLTALEVDGSEPLVSDSSWRCTTDPSYSSDVQRISIYGSGQESRDLRRSEPWINLSFDDTNWEFASATAGKGELPWKETQISPLKNLVESILHPVKISSKFGPYKPDPDPHQEMRSAFLHSPHEITLPAGKEGSKLPPVKQEDVLLLCYDLGHSQAGSARLLFRGAQGGENVLVSYLEKEIDGNLILSDPSTYCQMRMTDRIVLASGQNIYEPFAPRGGRFLLLGIVGPSDENLSLDVEFRSRRYPLKLENISLPKEETLRQIVEMCWLTIQSCALDGMVDCPWREQAIWVGDSVITSGIIAEICGDPVPFRHLLQLAAQGTTDDGLLPGVVVNDSESTVVLAYSFAWVEGLSKYLALTGETSFVLKLWKTLSTMLNRFQTDLASDGLLRAQPTRRQFLDWAELPENEPSCLYNLRYLYALQLASSMASELGQSNDAKLWKDRANTLAAAIGKMFFQHGKWFDDSAGVSRSQHVATFLTLTKLLDQEESSNLMQEAVECSVDDQQSDLVLMSPYMHYYLFLALEQMGRVDDILLIIRRRWGDWLERGARTTWENWEVDFPDGSQCHAWSAHPLLFVSRHADCKNLGQ